MTIDELVGDYLDAWNRKDVEALLGLMHSGAAYYDAFWMEICVGRDLEQYIRDSMAEESYRYTQVGKTIPTAHGVVYRYSAYDQSGESAEDPVFHGAETLTILDGKILTITDVYCSPAESDLLELAELAAGRHGLARHVNDGLGALKEARIKSSLSATINQGEFYLDPEITMSRLAEMIGCPLNHLTTVIEKRFDVTARDFINYQRIQRAKELLATNTDKPAILEAIDSSVGFVSPEDFDRQFTLLEGITPAAFLRKMRRSSRDSATSGPD